MRKLRIAVFTDTFYPHVNGVVSAIHSSTKGLLDLGHEVLIFAPKSLLKIRKPVQYTNLNVDIVYLPSIPVVDRGLRLSFPFFPLTAMKIRNFKPDIIHFHMPLTLGMEAILASKVFEKPLIATFHTFFMEEEYLKRARLSKLRAGKVFKKLGWEFSSLFYNQADIIISPSKYTAENIRSNGCTKPVVNIPNAIEFSEGSFILTQAQKDELRKHYKIPHGNKVIIWLGRLGPEKNLLTALKAFQMLLKKDENVTFLLIGDGPERNKLEKFVKHEILKGQVVFAGIVDHNLLINNHILQTGDMFFSASTSENQPISALEAMAEGLPIVVTDKRGMPELVEGNGFVCQSENVQEMADKLHLLLSDEKQRALMSENSRLISKKYSSEIVAKELEGLYFGVLEKREKSRN